MTQLASWISVLLLLLAASCEASTAPQVQGIPRAKCENRVGVSVTPVSIYRRRLASLREEMQIRAKVQGSELDAFIITSYDDHQSELVAEEDKRRQWLSGFNGSNGDVAVTLHKAALWTDNRFLQQADAELDCEWLLFRMGDSPSLSEWLSGELRFDSAVGADPHTVPHYLWEDWDYDFSRKYIRFLRIPRNPVDSLWGAARPAPHNDVLRVHPVVYAGERWEAKVDRLRENMTAQGVDAMVVTSLTEIAYLLNLRGNDIPYVPVFKSYLVVTPAELFLYVNQSRINLGVTLHLKAEPCHHEHCVRIKDYYQIWGDLRTFSQAWKRILVPAPCVYDMGASEAIVGALPSAKVVLRGSPIIFMRAQKNAVERRGMMEAHVRDAATMCDVFHYLEERFTMGAHYTEQRLSHEIDLSRRSQKLSFDISFETTVAFGEHSALVHYKPNNASDAEITEDGMLVVDSGGQYLDGTTEVARTLHLGTPTAEQKRAYTLVLAAVIKLSMLVFPEDIRLSDIDILPRNILWGDHQDYPHGTGHGVGSYLGAKESPVNIAYSAKHRQTFKDGYFFSVDPAFYKNKNFGVRLKNVLEVYDTGKVHPSGKKFLAFRTATLVPFEPKLIDWPLLSIQERRWLNDYNSRIREHVGHELKSQLKMPAFYWMMNQTRHVSEYIEMSGSGRPSVAVGVVAFLSLLFIANLTL